jgi:hypothetical protein
MKMFRDDIVVEIYKSRYQNEVEKHVVSSLKIVGI